MTMTHPNGQPAAPAANHTQTQAPQYEPPPAPLAIRPDGAYRMALEPQTFSEAMHACDLLSSAGITGCETPPIILSKVMAGRALGMGFMSAVMGIDIIKGTLALRAKTKVALCLQSPLCEYFECVETTATTCTWKTKRVGREEKRHTYTIEDARKSLLLGRGEKDSMNNYDRYPAQMLVARASSFLADLEFPDVLKGMASTEEMQEVAARDPREMVGEVVPAAQKRDFAGEANAIVAKIETITAAMSTADRMPIRKEVMAWAQEAPEPYKTTVLASYNNCPKYAPPSNKAPTGPQSNLPGAGPPDPNAGA